MEPFASMINHSCDPNVFFFMEGSQLRFRTIKQISAGEELFLSYTDPTYDIMSRRTELLATYHFTCTCHRCKLELAQPRQDYPIFSCAAEQLDLQEKLLKSQREIATTGLSPDDIEQHLHMIVAHRSPASGSPKDLWPEHFQPMPDMRLFIAAITQEVHPEYSVKTLLRLCFVTFHKIHGGLDWRYWVHAFSVLTFTLRILIKCARREGRVQIANWSVVYIVYLKKMVEDAEKCYGADTAFVQSNKALLKEETNIYPPEVLCSQGLVRQFRQDQMDMFKWGGVSHAKGVQLGDAGIVIPVA